VDGQRREQLWQVVAARGEVSGQAAWAQAVCEACVRSLKRVDGATLTLRTASQAQEMLGASDAWAAGLAQTQYTLGEGPGVEAFTVADPVLAADLARDGGRWPVFVEAALAAGVGAMFAFPLQIGAITLGTVELFRRGPGALSPSEAAEAVLLAALVTSALLDQAEQDEREAERQWDRPLTSYQDVNVATGMLATQLRIGLNDAFARLRAHAFASGRPVVEVARDVLARRIRLEELSE
jgi:hypothetical protein